MENACILRRLELGHDGTFLCSGRGFNDLIRLISVRRQYDVVIHICFSILQMEPDLTIFIVGDVFDRGFQE